MGIYAQSRQALIFIFPRETEILDVAPIDLLNGMSKEFMRVLPVPDALKAKALDVKFHWVNETGKVARLTSGISMDATVCLRSRNLRGADTDD